MSRRNPWNIFGLALGLVTALAGISTVATTYDISGDPIKVAKPGGVTVTATYDAYGNLTSESGTGAEAASPTLTYGYDTIGRLISAQVGTDTAQTFSYNDRNLLVSSAGPSGSSAFTYTPAGRVAARTDAAGTATYTYSNGALSSLTDPVSGARISYGYDAADRPTTITYGSGGPVETLGYDAAGRVTSDVLTASGSTLYGFQNTWTGDLLSTQTVVGAGANVGANTYTYDRSGRLLSWTPPSGGGESYTYDADGNRTSVNATTASYDARDRLVSAGSWTFAYTPRGTLLSTTSPTLIRTTEDNAYDQLASDNGVTNTYDGLGRLATAGTATFSYAGAETAPVSDGASTFGRAAGLISTTAGGVVSFDVTNTRGDLIAQTSTTGALTGTQAYAPYGTVTATTGAFASALGYQGGWTSGSGLVDMTARWYDPTTGAFTSHDLLNAGNPYAYAAGNPITHNDPSGLDEQNAGGGAWGLPAGNPVAEAAPEPVVRLAPAPVGPSGLGSQVGSTVGISALGAAGAVGLGYLGDTWLSHLYGGLPAPTGVNQVTYPTYPHAHPGTYGRAAVSPSTEPALTPKKPYPAGTGGGGGPSGGGGSSGGVSTGTSRTSTGEPTQCGGGGVLSGGGCTPITKPAAPPIVIHGTPPPPLPAGNTPQLPQASVVAAANAPSTSTSTGGSGGGNTKPPTSTGLDDPCKDITGPPGPGATPQEQALSLICQELAAASETTLYRAVSSAERADIESFGGFRAGPNSYEGKLFATSAEDAARFGRISDTLTPGGEPFHIVEARVPTSLAKSFEYFTADSMQAVHVAEDQLGAVNTGGSWNIWDWVPRVGKPGAGL